MKSTQLIIHFLEIVLSPCVTHWLILTIFPEGFLFQTATITLNEAVKSNNEPKDTISFAIFLPKPNFSLSIQFKVSREENLNSLEVRANSF